jgi:hypothetical protein
MMECAFTPSATGMDAKVLMKGCDGFMLSTLVGSFSNFWVNSLSWLWVMTVKVRCPSITAVVICRLDTFFATRARIDAFTIFGLGFSSSARLRRRDSSLVLL